jgi:hypothetical protein
MNLPVQIEMAADERSELIRSGFETTSFDKQQKATPL